MKHVYLFEAYKFGYDVEHAEYLEYDAESIEDARYLLMADFPKAYVLNEYVKLSPHILTKE